MPGSQFEISYLLVIGGLDTGYALLDHRYLTTILSPGTIQNFLR